MPDNPTPSRQSAKRIGDLIKRSFLNYVDHWQEWIVPTVVAGAIAVASLCCCWVPSIFVMGPVACGLYACALAALRNRPVNAGLLGRGWQRFGGSAAASIFITVVSALPVLLLFGLFMAFFAAIATVTPSPPFDQQYMNRVESVDELATTTEETPDEVHLPMEDALSDETDGALRSPQQVEEPPPLFIFLAMCAVLLFYALFFLAIILAWVWQLWFTTRVMFVYPLLADRDIGFVESVRYSWRESRVRFWELLLLNLAAQIISMAGMYFMYVGMLFTIPIGLTIVAAVYEDRFTAADRVDEDEPPAEE